MNENDSYLFDVELPTAWVFSGEPTWISGWFLSKQDAVFSDIRAVTGGVVHLGILGLPRPDVEERHRGRIGLPHAGFVLQVRPPAGAKELRLELLDAGGRWVEFWRMGVKVRKGPAPGGRLNAGIVPDQLRKLLQAHRADPAADLTAIARPLARDSAVVPLDTLPNPPFFGALERPLLTGGSQFGKVNVEGWIIHREQRIRRLVASTHPLVEVEMDYGARERADAGAMFPGHPYAARAQYFGMVDIDEHGGDPACLKVFADLEDGTRHLVFARRFYQRSCTQMEQPLPEFSRTVFVQAALAFANACRAEGIRLGRLADYWRQCQEAHRLFHRFAPASLAHRLEAAPDAYAAWQRSHALTPRLRQLLEENAKPAGRPARRFTFLIDARGCTATQLNELTASLRKQIHPHWQACFVGAMAPETDSHLKSFPVGRPGDFIAQLNAATQGADGSHLALLPGHSRLSSDALAEIASVLAARPTLELVYTDEDRMDDSGRRADPTFKPEWSPALADSGLFPGQLCVIRRERCVALGAFRAEYPLLPWADLLLRLGDSLKSEDVAHLPLVCYHSRASVPREISPADPSVEEARRSLADAARRRGRTSAPFLPDTGHRRLVRYHQFRPEPGVLARLPVTIVIPTRDRLHLLQECVELLEETVDWRHVKLVIVDDHSRDADAVRYLAAIQRRTDLRCVVVRPADRAAPFNYSHLVNLARPHLDTPLVLHLNNDVNALESGWLEEMASWFLQPDIGVVGARLVHPDKTLNHTGIIVGPHGGLADTPYARADPAKVPVAGYAAAREVSAVTGACLMTRTGLYAELGGFDEKDFGVAYNDVDYCLRIRATGRRVIYTPQALLMHWGSATRGVTFDAAEHIAFVRRYPSFRDPFLSPHLRLEGNFLRCSAAAPARTQHADRPLRLLLLTHNLNLEGAPLFLLEYATWMAREAGFGLEVLSSQDGPLRAAYEALGAHLTVIDAAPVYAAADEEIFHSRVADIAHHIDWEPIDLVVCNTLVSFWGVHLARRAGKPSLFYIHESATIFRFFERKLELDLHRLVAQAFHDATRALFLCQATRAYYEDHNVSGNFRLVPSWIKLDDVESFRAAHDRAGLRRKHGFADDETIIANIGTVCERKGQHVFLRAIEHFNRQGHRGKFRFVMVGARPGIYLDLLKRDIARLVLPNLTLVPETREVFDFFVAADQFVCTSFEESFPRVVMEAMAFRTPIVTTDVHGIAEMIGQRQDGYLVPAGDHLALSKMMWTCLAKEHSGKSLTPTAYSKALRLYDHRKVLPFHVGLAREAWLAHS